MSSSSPMPPNTMSRLETITGHITGTIIPASATPTITPQLTASGSSSPAALNEVVIVGYARTPIGGGPIGGQFAHLTAPELGGYAIRGAVAKAGISPDLVEEVFFGNVLSAGVGQAPARQAALAGGLSQKTPCTTLNKVCASAMKAFMVGCDAIRLGDRECVIVGGMESMSNAPFLLKRGGLKMGNDVAVDEMIYDGLTDAYSKVHMGTAAELIAQRYGITRQEQDAYARQSYERAQAATKAGKFNSEIVPIEVKGRDGKIVRVTTDEEVFRANFERFPTLKPTFPTTVKGVSPANQPAPIGTITAANSSSIGDGAAALVLMSATKARSLGLKPLARFLAHGDAALAPLDYPIVPELACRRAIAKAGLSSPDQVDIWELNEAFSLVALVNMKLLNIPASKINLNGGGVSLGHPIGCSGARIICTLITVLQQEDKSIGCASLCNGGGGASAVVIQRL